MITTAGHEINTPRRAPITSRWQATRASPPTDHLNVYLRTPQLPAAHAEAGTVLAHWTGHYTFDNQPNLLR